MIPAEGEYLSFLMGASAISDDELEARGVEIAEGAGTAVRCVRVPSRALESYKELVRQKLQPGFWTDLVGPAEICFLFKLRDGTMVERTYGPESCDEIARLCSLLNGDPIEKTSNLLQYMATNSFYRDTMVACYAVGLE